MRGFIEEFISTNLNNNLLDLSSVINNGYNFAGAIILDPVEGFLVDGQGRRLGYSETIGAITEIPGSSWLGEEDGIGFFLEPVEGPFQLDLTGLGEDYYVSVELETEDGPAGIESEGFLAAGEQLTLDVPVNNAPVLDLNGDADGINATASISQNGGTTSITDSNLTIFDSEDQNLASATVTIQNPEDGNFELLGATATGNITVNYDATTSTLTLDGTDTITNYQQVLSSVTYTNNATNPNTTPREIEFVVDDGASFNNFSTPATTNISFLADGSGGQKTFTINQDSGTTTILNFGGAGTNPNPSNTVLSEVDILEFQGASLTPSNLLLTQSGNDLIINFEGVDNTEVILTNFILEDLNNLTNQIGNIHFLGDENNNSITGSESIDFLSGLGGNDTLNGKEGDDNLDGGEGNDTLIGDSGNDYLVGSEGNDSLTGNTGNDTIQGGAGDDTIKAGIGNDVIDGGAGFDKLVVDYSEVDEDFQISLGSGNINVYFPETGNTTVTNFNNIESFIMMSSESESSEELELP